MLEGCAPLDLIILMLGTNDCKKRFSLDPWDIGWGMDLLIQYVKRSACGRDGNAPDILVVSPPAMGDEWDKTSLGTVIGEGATRRARALPAIYKEIADRNGVFYFDAALHAKAEKDSVHLTIESHRRLGRAIAAKVAGILEPVR